jgi:hypothetical protein
MSGFEVFMLCAVGFVGAVVLIAAIVPEETALDRTVKHATTRAAPGDPFGLVASTERDIRRFAGMAKTNDEFVAMLRAEASFERRCANDYAINLGWVHKEIANILDAAASHAERTGAAS